jgi:hypothetical protein
VARGSPAILRHGQKTILSLFPRKLTPMRPELLRRPRPLPLAADFRFTRESLRMPGAAAMEKSSGGL